MSGHGMFLVVASSRASREIQRAIVQAQDMPPRIAQNVMRPILFTAHLRLEQLVEDANFYPTR
jgi:hypothetical protein